MASFTFIASAPSAPSRPPFFALTNEALSEVTRSLATKLDGRSASFIEMMDNASANMKLSDPVLRKNGMALWCSLLRRASVEADGQRATGDSPATEEAPVAGPSTAAPSKRADTGMVRSLGLGDVPLTKDHDSVTCRWNGCEMVMKGQNFKSHLLGYDVRGHRAHIDSLAGAGKYTRCHWAGCRAPEMKVASLERHVLNMHVQMDRYRCSRCGTTKRKDAYLSQHGPARHCTRLRHPTPAPQDDLPPAKRRRTDTCSPLDADLAMPHPYPLSTLYSAGSPPGEPSPVAGPSTVRLPDTGVANIEGISNLPCAPEPVSFGYLPPSLGKENIPMLTGNMGQVAGTSLDPIMQEFLDSCRKTEEVFDLFDHLIN
ncbi:hypothetical protein BC628DRAFT_72749 [Trametes gibbosa]|nr:hypothetical protein BC628DRAFT_72749 [Trametes gibbosa]